MNHYTREDIIHMMWQMAGVIWGLPLAAVALFWVLMLVIVLIRGHKNPVAKNVARRVA